MAINQDKLESSTVARRFEIAIMAKAPIAGFAKTRLIPLLGAEGAADLQNWLLQKTVTTALAAKLGPISLWCAPDCDLPAFAKCADHDGVNRYRQPDGDLGARMLAAAERESGRLGTVIVGTDCPTLGVDDILKACQAICEGNDAAIIPAEDGGYVLIAVRQAYAALFTDIDWSTQRVMSQTRQRAQEAGIRLVEFLPKWDVDLAEDFARLLSVFPELCQRFSFQKGNVAMLDQVAMCR